MFRLHLPWKLYARLNTFSPVHREENSQNPRQVEWAQYCCRVQCRQLCQYLLGLTLLLKLTRETQSIPGKLWQCPRGFVSSNSKSEWMKKRERSWKINSISCSWSCWTLRGPTWRTWRRWDWSRRRRRRRRNVFIMNVDLLGLGGLLASPDLAGIKWTSGEISRRWEEEEEQESSQQSDIKLLLAEESVRAEDLQECRRRTKYRWSFP